MMKFVIFGVHQLTRICVDYFLSKQDSVLWAISDQYPHPAHLPKNALLTVYHYTDIADPKLLNAIETVAPDIVFTIVLGDKIPHSIIRCAKQYALNFHPSELPGIRSGNAWFWPICLGRSSAAVTIHLLEEAWDSGDIVFERTFELGPYDTQGVYIQKIVANMSHWIDAFYNELVSNQLTPRKQGKGQYYPKLRVKDICIDWETSANPIAALIRACNPYHFAITFFRDHVLKIIEAQVTTMPSQTPGQIRIENQHLLVGTADFDLQLSIIYLEHLGVFSADRFIPIMAVKEGEQVLNMMKMPHFQVNAEMLL